VANDEQNIEEDTEEEGVNVIHNLLVKFVVRLES